MESRCDRGFTVLVDHYFVCGNKACKYLPPNQQGMSCLLLIQQSLGDGIFKLEGGQCCGYRTCWPWFWSRRVLGLLVKASQLCFTCLPSFGPPKQHRSLAVSIPQQRREQPPSLLSEFGALVGRGGSFLARQETFSSELFPEESFYIALNSFTVQKL